MISSNCSTNINFQLIDIVLQFFTQNHIYRPTDIEIINNLSGLIVKKL